MAFKSLFSSSYALASKLNCKPQRFFCYATLGVTISLTACGGGGSDNGSSVPVSTVPPATGTPSGNVPNNPVSPTVQTFAGTGSPGFFNGIGSAASFRIPAGIATDAAGNLYVADYGNRAIRKISPTGVVTTLAGGSSRGFVNGTGTAASFESPQGVAVDTVGNVYVPDSDNQAIRKVSAAGVVTTLAGGGTLASGFVDSGFVNGTGIAARFRSPLGVAVDSVGNVYVADFGNNAIRKISSSGVVSTVAGTGASGFADGPSTTATFNGPTAVAVDAAGTIYVADTNNHTIRKISPAGTVSTLAGVGRSVFDTVTGPGAGFNSPRGLVVDSAGNVYVADQTNAAIRKVFPSGVITSVVGNDLTKVHTPFGIALDAAGNIYFSDHNSNTIRKILL